MDDTSSGSQTPPLDHAHPASTTRRRRPGLVPVAAAVAAASLLLTVSACAGGGSSDSAASSKDAARLFPQAGAPARAAPSAAPADGVGSGFSVGSSAAHFTALNGIGESAFDRQQIKTAHLGIHSTTIQTVTSSIKSVADSEGGFVASENTVTNVKGVATSSAVTVRVPVDNFDAAVTELGQLGKVYDRRISTVDVTGRVADVASRVTSAKDSIAQLRVLFSHATKLSDIITLESELSQREADLEALLAQQRALTNQTTLSTVSVQVTRPPMVTTTTKVQHEDKSTGFVGGLKQGWDALASTFLAVSHGLGAALPLGLTLLVIAGLLWAAVRRIPRRRVDTSG